MSDVISTAGLGGPVELTGPNTAAPNPTREAVKAIRAVLRRAEASDDEVDDALEALIELGKL